MLYIGTGVWWQCLSPWPCGMMSLAGGQERQRWRRSNNVFEFHLVIALLGEMLHFCILSNCDGGNSSSSSSVALLLVCPCWWWRTHAQVCIRFSTSWWWSIKSGVLLQREIYINCLIAHPTTDWAMICCVSGNCFNYFFFFYILRFMVNSLRLSIVSELRVQKH